MRYRISPYLAFTFPCRSLGARRPTFVIVGIDAQASQVKETKMQRGSVIAVVAAAAGILVAGSAASVAVINAANSGTSDVGEPIVAASVAAIEPVSDSQEVVLPDPAVDDAPLPKVIVPSPVGTPGVGSESSSEPDDEQTTKARVTATPAPTPTETNAAPSAKPTATPDVISARQAKDAALAATPGTVLGTSLVKHAGYEAYAVQIRRADGSVVTGFVEANSGVVYDWVVDQPAPTPTPTATYDDDDGYDDDHDDDRDDDHDDDRDDDDD
jgi:uncharacterized membrane protein YkoI